MVTVDRRWPVNGELMSFTIGAIIVIKVERCSVVKDIIQC